MSAIAYEIHVQGIVDEASLEDLGEVEVSTVSATTVLTGNATDQAALLGLLARLRAHGLVVTELHRHRAKAPPAEAG